MNCPEKKKVEHDWGGMYRLMPSQYGILYRMKVQPEGSVENNGRKLVIVVFT